MFCYGENNYVDFTQLDGIVGMFAPNASGKSTLLDAIAFCCFDRCSRTKKAAHVKVTSKECRGNAHVFNSCCSCDGFFLKPTQRFPTSVCCVQRASQ